MKQRPIRHASLNWQDDTPISEQFDDIYFNKDGGLAETDYVFMQGNQLARRFAESTTTHFTLAETGFGTGLNFLCARALWLQHSQPDQTLHFISVEKYPLTPQDLRQALAQHPSLQAGALQLIEQYPPALNGFHRLNMDDGRIKLTLMLGDADHCYSQLDGRVDAWLLDGFAPAKNPEMWTEELFDNIARCSHQGTTFATFTAAGVVRRGLQGVGFAVEKVPGFGRKREMLIGHYQGPTQPLRRKAPWFQRPQPLPATGSVAVVGGGLAGLCSAWSLAQRGYTVTVLERAPQLAANGSGNRQGALYAKPTLEATKQARLHLTGMLYSQRWLKQIDPKQTLWDDCGVLVCAQNAKVSQRFKQISAAGHIPTIMLQPLTNHQASDIAGLPVTGDALFFPDAGWVNPAALCTKLSEHPNIEVKCNWPVEQLRYNEEQQHWQLYQQAHDTQSHTTEHLCADIVVIAAAAETRLFNQSNHLPLKPIRGQVSHASVPPNTPSLQTVVCADGYISPSSDGNYCFGATFDINDPTEALRAADRDKNLQTLAVALPTLAEQLAQQPLTEGRVGWRCASSDYLPLIGELADSKAFIHQYAKLRSDARWPFDQTPPARYPGLFVNVGHGSKGLITCPISGELLAALICNEPLPADQEVCDAVNPCRFLVKNLIRQTI